jgi:hypothetical protein
VDWACEQHKFLTGGAKWSEAEGLNNTCPIDNHLNCFGEISCCSPDFLELFNRENPADKAFYDCVLSASHGDFESAQCKWANFVGTDNLNGSPSEIIIDKLQETCQFVKKGVCSAENCPQKQQIQLQPKDFYLNPAEDIQETFQKIVNVETEDQCNHCLKIGVSDSKVKYGPLLPKNEENPPPFLYISNTTNSTFIDLCKLPKGIKIGEFLYNQTMVVQHKSTGGGHFNAMINLDRRWLKYDGIDHTGDGFIKIAHPRDFADGAFTPDTVTCTIKTD